MLAVGVAACGGGGSVAAVGRAAPAFSTYDLTGRAVALDDSRGHVVLLNFWASWCTPCRAEFPRLQAVNGDEVRVLGVVFDDSMANAARFMREQSASWPGLVDPKAQIADAYGVHHKPGIPITFAISPAGTVRAKHFGPATDADLRALIATARH